MYTYKYVAAKVGRLLSMSNYKELIDEHAKEGWRLVTTIPSEFGGYGQIKTVDLVFEKWEEEKQC